MADLSSVLPTLSPSAYFGIPVRNGPQPPIPSLPSMPPSMLAQARTSAAQAQQTPTLPPVAPAAPSTSFANGPITPPPAAPNVIQGGVPGAMMPSEVPGMLHPADHAIAYAQHLATQRDIQPFDGTNVNEFTTLDANSPRMEGPAPAAPNIIRGGVPSGGGAAGGGMNLMQLEAIRPMLQAKQEATQLNPTLTIPNELMAMAKYRRDQRIASKEDPTKVMADYEGELYRIHNQTLALIQALAQH